MSEGLPKFINPLCGVNNTDSALNKTYEDKQEFYNCLVKDEWRQNKWTCYGPYLNPEDATALKGLDVIPKHKSSLLVPVSSYLPHRIDIIKTLVSHTFPEVQIKSVGGLGGDAISPKK
jgi:hypothetical protein